MSPASASFCDRPRTPSSLELGEEFLDQVVAAAPRLDLLGPPPPPPSFICRKLLFFALALPPPSCVRSLMLSLC